MSEAQSPVLRVASSKRRRYPEDFKRDAVRLVPTSIGRIPEK